MIALLKRKKESPSDKGTSDTVHMIVQAQNISRQLRFLEIIVRDDDPSGRSNARIALPQDLRELEEIVSRLQDVLSGLTVDLVWIFYKPPLDKLTEDLGKMRTRLFERERVTKEVDLHSSSHKEGISSDLPNLVSDRPGTSSNAVAQSGQSISISELAGASGQRIDVGNPSVLSPLGHSNMQMDSLGETALIDVAADELKRALDALPTAHSQGKPSNIIPTYLLEAYISMVGQDPRGTTLAQDIVAGTFNRRRSDLLRILGDVINGHDRKNETLSDRLALRHVPGDAEAAELVADIAAPMRTLAAGLQEQSDILKVSERAEGYHTKADLRGNWPSSPADKTYPSPNNASYDVEDPATITREAELRGKYTRKRTKTGCLTCRKRRIRCDEGQPVCQKCVKSRRECEGYGEKVHLKPLTSDDDLAFPRIAARPEVIELRDCLTGGESRRWFLSQLSKASTGMKTPASDILTEFEKLGYTHDAQPVRCFFTVAWSPSCAFGEGYEDHAMPLLGDFITATSDGDRIQMMRCGEYILQTWPTIGPPILDALERFLRKESFHKVALPHNASLFTLDCLESGEIVFGALASPIMLAEIGELFAWLGAACRITLSSKKRYYYRPDVRLWREQPNHESHFFNTGDHLQCQIWYRCDETARDSKDQMCWEALMRGLCIATGFYICPRSHAEPGLEISLPLMALLGDTPWLDTFAGKLMLKGISSAFTPVTTQQGSICWHFEHHDDGRFMSYSVSDKSCISKGVVRDWDITWLLSQRHYVGWTICSRSGLGTKSYDYSTLRRCDADEAEFAAARTSISGPRFINPDSQVVMNELQTPQWRRENRYLRTIDEISSYNVLLYDTAAKRAWLVDGCSALLHLTCHQLRSQNFVQNFKISDNDFKGYATTERTARQALLDNKVTQQILRQDVEDEKGQMSPEDARESAGALSMVEPFTKDRSTNARGLLNPVASRRSDESRQQAWRLQDLIETTCQYLLKMHDCARLSAEEHAGVTPDRDELRGWSFFELVEHQPAYLDLLRVNLQPSGRSWSSYIDSVRAVTLLGDGFGDLIRPDVEADMCAQWTTAPINKDYLITTVERLRHNTKNVAKFPSLITQTIAWHQPAHLFSSCDCTSVACDPVQTMLPTRMFRVKPPDVPPEALRSGAVMFGSTEACPVWYPKDARKLPQLDPDGVKAALEEQEELRRDPLEDLAEAPFIDLSSSGSQASEAPTDLLSSSISGHRTASDSATSVQGSDRSAVNESQHKAAPAGLTPTEAFEPLNAMHTGEHSVDPAQAETAAAEPPQQADTAITTTAASAAHPNDKSSKGTFGKIKHRLAHHKGA